ncbi:MAG: hypothetical protein ABW168_12595 [Sedimenticola sp.]
MTISLTIIILSGCATTTKVEKTNFSSQPKEQNCEIVFYKDSKPSEPYTIVGKVESHIKKNLFFGGTVQLEDEAYTELRTKACGLGGDFVIIDDYIETSAAEMSHVHVWATVLKLPK